MKAWSHTVFYELQFLFQRDSSYFKVTNKFNIYISVGSKYSFIMNILMDVISTILQKKHFILFFLGKSNLIWLG